MADTKYEPYIGQYRELIKDQAARHNLDPNLIAGLIMTESGGNTYACRPELGFWKRYAKGIARLIASTPNDRDNHWAKYPELSSSSYGLMQILYVVAIENGELLQFPTELCNPAVNVKLGCKLLADKTRKAGTQRAGLLAYNGGGDLKYPDRVIKCAEEILYLNFFKGN